jgi:hypothetical protein
MRDDAMYGDLTTMNFRQMEQDMTMFADSMPLPLAAYKCRVRS